jgi:hypothetical protein
VLFAAFTLLWQLFTLLACCLGVGLAFRFLLPKEFSLLNKVLFSFMGGLFLVVLIPQNLVYLGIPVRISAWLLLAAALLQAWFCRHKFVAWIRTFYSNAEVRTLAVIIFLTITFHCIIPIQQGLEWYYGKGYDDQLNYVLLAEFLKEEPYRTSEQNIGLRPWLTGVVGVHDPTDQIELSSGSGLEAIGLKKERIGQSIVTAEISVWSGTNGKAGYAATVIFFLTLLAICLYVLLRETGINRFMAGSGALMAAFLPGLTRLSLNGFLSQVSILFVFPFFASLLRKEELNARSFTLFFSLTLAYLIAAYSEIAPIGLCTLFLGVMFARKDTFRTKRLMFMSAILLTALLNPFYLPNLVKFLWQQYNLAANATFLEKLAPNVLTLRGWSELIFGDITNAPFALFFDYCAILLGILFLAGAIILPRRDRPVFGAILLPCILVIFYLSTRIPRSYYPIAKITLTFLPLAIALVFVALSVVAANNHDRSIGMVKKLLCAIIVVAAAAGSTRYYSEVLKNGGLLSFLREPRFLNVCRELEQIKNQRVLVFETNPLLAAWLCYHARHNEVYFDGRLISDSPVPPNLPFSKVPDLENIDQVAMRGRLVDLKAAGVFCLTSVDDLPGEVRIDGHDRYWLGPPARLRFLASRAMSANLNLRLIPGPEATTFPIDFFLADEQGHVSQGEIRGEAVDVRQIDLPRGASYMQLSVKAKVSEPKMAQTFPIVAKLEDLEISDIDLNPEK